MVPLNHIISISSTGYKLGKSQEKGQPFDVHGRRQTG